MKIKRSFLGLILVILVLAVPVFGEEINKIEVVEKSIEENTDKHEVKVKYPMIHGGEKEVVDKINKTIENYTLDWINDIKLLGEEYSKEYEKAGTPMPKMEAYSLFEAFNTDEVISLPVTYYQYTGGAHGLTTKVSYNYDLKTGKILKLNDLFKEGFDYKSIIDKKVREDIEKEKDIYFENGALFKGVNENQAYYLNKDGIIVYFQQYEIAPYSSGIREFKIPYGELKEGLVYKLGV
ncbi:DUF3298 and DUF4163 domain-containing protein [Clostridium sp. LIBA-8841]|uniref:DUF3298 and DUF4163 domain-containing protein n=1 Tax=Clostridium sp. LIBA-8841 TaxID=2987530 RepID=UPI002AC7CA7A|nr:DUF3298 and DUF4163 domain-containing protein [Clostridium sp. LIBA-8841]MDZ5255036.1 DUF3298 and DUF4163 domain-containing protein [Clostridium sp. LIBA-8841]